ncbi:MAG: CBS domain-containing protein [Eubacterium sp.]|nr:CBS domain-containing protein [Eubacterium sp.]
MNILFFLTPKSEVAYTTETDTMTQLMALMDERKFTAIPVLNPDGIYVGTVTEGDLLRQVYSWDEWKPRDAEKVKVAHISRRREIKAVRANSDMEDLIQTAMQQNFVPVTDDDGVFIGIITRKSIIGYCYEHSSLKDGDSE